MSLYLQLYICAMLLSLLGLFPIHHQLVRLLAATLIGFCALGSTWIFPQLLGGSPYLLVNETIPWLGFAMSWQINLWSAIFLFLIFTIGALVLTYSQFYFSSAYDRRRVTALLSLFALAMIGLVSTTNLIALFVFWEMTTVISFLLIAFQFSEEKARKAALRALTLTGVGGFGLLWFVGWCGFVGGSFDLIELARIENLESFPGVHTALFGLALAALTKSAQFPFHFWLPGAMAAPTPISSYLHSATMVKAGLFLLGATHFFWIDHALWTNLFFTLGMITALWGLVVSLQQDDLKNVFAWTTVSALGLILVAITVDQPSLKNAALLLLGHGFYKAAGFFWVGHIDHDHGSRMISQLKSSGSWLRAEQVVLIVIMLALMGLPPGLSGSAKSLAFSGSPALIFFLAAISFLSGMLAYRLLSPFLRDVRINTNPRSQLPALLSLALAMIIIEALLSYTLKNLMGDKSLLVTAVKYMALFAGVFASDWLQPLERGFFKRIASLDFAQFYDSALKGLIEKFALGTAGVFNRPPSSQLQSLWILAFALLLPLFIPWQIPLDGISVIPQQAGWLLQGALVVLLSLLGLVFVNSWWAALLILSGVGIGITLVFGFLGAPDLALTQLLVEAITLVLILTLYRRLPPWPAGEKLSLLTHARAGLAAGLSFLVLVSVGLATLANPWKTSVGQAHAQLAKSEGDGLNVVNVILVDFRGFDTLGEITVLVIAACAIFVVTKSYLRSEAQG